MTILSSLIGRSPTSDATPSRGVHAPTERPASNAAGRAAGTRDYCRTLLRAEDDPENNDAALQSAWKRLRAEMALVPEGEVQMMPTDPQAFCDPMAWTATQPVAVASIYIDRHCVTNREFADFVTAGCYGMDHLWPTEILANVLQFVDRSGAPGPRGWNDGHFPAHTENHPVTGVCWYEANAFAHWCGKRLPTPAEWQRAATWATPPSATGGSVAKYPWGDSFDGARCNTFSSGVGTTVPVNEYYGGCTPNGVYQLIGNVWEWTAAIFECDTSGNGDRVLTEFPLAEIRGGAFDTYFASQATSLFRTGQALLQRRSNVGFRCCVVADQLTPLADPYAFLEDGAAQ